MYLGKRFKWAEKTYDNQENHNRPIHVNVLLIQNIRSPGQIPEIIMCSFFSRIFKRQRSGEKFITIVVFVFICSCHGGEATLNYFPHIKWLYTYLDTHAHREATSGSEAAKNYFSYSKTGNHIIMYTPLYHRGRPSEGTSYGEAAETYLMSRLKKGISLFTF